MTSNAYNTLYDVALHCVLLCFLNCDVLHSMILLCCCVVICGGTVRHPVAVHGVVSYCLTLCCVVVYGVCGDLWYCIEWYGVAFSFSPTLIYLFYRIAQF